MVYSFCFNPMHSPAVHRRKCHCSPCDHKSFGDRGLPDAYTSSPLTTTTTTSYMLLRTVRPSAVWGLQNQTPLRRHVMSLSFAMSSEPMHVDVVFATYTIVNLS